MFRYLHTSSYILICVCIADLIKLKVSPSLRVDLQQTDPCILQSPSSNAKQLKTSFSVKLGK